MIIDSHNWDPSTGTCRLHPTLSLPCQPCISGRNPDVEVRLEAIDLMSIATDEATDFRGYLPAGPDGDWLMGRITA